MNDLPEYSHLMFLDPSIERYVAQVRATHAISLDFAYRLNQFGNRALFAVGVSPHDAKELLLSTLLRRILTSFQASIIICERGLPLEAQVLLRTVLEVTFKIVAIANDEEVAQLFIGEGLINKRKKYEKLRKLNSTDFQGELDEMSEAHKVLAEKIKTEGIRELTTFEFAKRAGLENFYHSAYSVLSDAVHSSVNTLDGTLDLDAQGDLVGLKYGFSDDDLNDHVFTACEALMISLKAALSVIGPDLVEEVQELQNDFAKAYGAVISAG